MKTLVIHPFDITTGFLEDIYINHDWTIIDTNVSHKIMKDSIKSHNRIIMLGHGSDLGLLGFGRYMIDSKLVYLLREKDCICIWCNANMFVEKYKLKGFYTGMIISEYEEAVYCDVNTTLEEIYISNVLFADSIKKSITQLQILDEMLKHYTGDSNVIMYNRNNLYETD